jgi:hypothetical protein
MPLLTGAIGLGAFALYGYTNERIFEVLRYHVFQKEFNRLDREADRNVSDDYVNKEANRITDEYIESLKKKTDAVACALGTVGGAIIYQTYFAPYFAKGGGRKKNQRGGTKENKIFIIDFTNEDGKTHKSVMFSSDPNDKLFEEVDGSVYSFLMEDEIYNKISDELVFKKLNKAEINAAINSASKNPLGILKKRGEGEKFSPMSMSSMPMGQRTGMAYGGKRSKRRRSSKRRSKRSKRHRRTKRT